MTEERLIEATLEEHISELKSRIIKCIVIFIVFCSLSLYFADSVYNFLSLPLIKVMHQDNIARKLIFTGLTEGFMTHMRLSLFMGFALSFPYIIYQLYQFIAPGLYRNEKKLILPFVFSAVILSFIGMAIAYFLVAPVACKFFIGFEGIINYNNHNIPIVLEARVSEYLSTIIQLLVSFSIVFQMPILLIMLGKVGILSVDTLIKYRRHAIVINFIFSAIITPPDVISQIMLAIPMIVLYEVSIFLLKKI
jgi:sec-independent protein translocase protein TatC